MRLIDSWPWSRGEGRRRTCDTGVQLDRVPRNLEVEDNVRSADQGVTLIELEDVDTTLGCRGRYSSEPGLTVTPKEVLLLSAVDQVIPGSALQPVKAAGCQWRARLVADQEVVPGIAEEPIVTQLAVDLVTLRPTVKSIVANIAGHPLGSGPAKSLVVAVRAFDRVGPGIANDGIIPEIADDAVVPNTPTNAVIAVATENKVVVAFTKKDVVIGPTEDRVVAGPGEHPVDARIPEDTIVAGPAVEGIVASFSEEEVVAGITFDAVVAGLTID